MPSPARAAPAAVSIMIFFIAGYMRGASRYMSKQRFTVVIEEDEDGVLVGSVAGLKGCHSEGNTFDELVANMKEAIEAHLELLKMRGVDFLPE